MLSARFFFGAGWTVRVSGPLAWVAAIPSHFTEPSGQRARVQLSEGISRPAASLSVKTASGLTVPLAKGTPQAVP